MPSDPNCLFCRIASGAIPSAKAFEDETVFAFADIHPKAPVHLLIIPKEHVLASVADMRANDQALIGQMIWRAKVLAEERGIATGGYRLVFNCRAHAGQEVDHIHLHLLGGQRLGPLA